MRVFLTTLGCRLNEAEAASWTREFRAAGHAVVPSPHNADLMVVNTCAVTSEAARKSRKLIRGLHAKNPGAKLAVTGCYSELQRSEASALPGVDVVVGNGDKDRLVSVLRTALDPCVMPDLATAADGAHAFCENRRTRAFIKVQDGCRNRCSFCIVTVARGQERSRTVHDVVREIRLLEREGVREVVITGVHLGGYGSDLNGDLSSLVAAVLTDTDVERVRLSSLEPWDLPDGFWSHWNNPRLLPHLHLPLQSGCDSVLKRMARRCNTEQYGRLVRSARDQIDRLTVTSDIIVGFPGETDDEWEQTKSFVSQLGLDGLHIFAYSARAGTRAATLPNPVPGEVKRRRSRELHGLAHDMTMAHMGRFVGTHPSVLWETMSDVDDDGVVVWHGYTDNYLRVRKRAPRSANLHNVIEFPLLTEIVADARQPYYAAS